MNGRNLDSVITYWFQNVQGTCNWASKDWSFFWFRYLFWDWKDLPYQYQLYSCNSWTRSFSMVMKTFYVHKMCPIECTVTGSTFNISGIVHRIIVFVDLGRMKSFRISSLNLPITWIYLRKFVVVISPQVVWLQWVDVPVGLENSVLVNVFYLKFSISFTSSLGFAWTYLVKCMGWLPYTGYLSI